MYISPVLPTDLKGNIDEEILVLSEKVCIESAKLTSSHNKYIINSIRELLRKTNSYYSNKIESEGTHPISIEKAMKKNFSENSKERNLQKLSLGYIETLKELEEQKGNIYNREFIKNIHRIFYEKTNIKDFLEIPFGADGKTLTMEIGRFRNIDVEVNDFLAPRHQELDSLFNEFETLYRFNKETSTKAKQLLYALSSHHRILYAHPFLDGNGRVARLFLDAALSDMNLEGYGLWNISRGLARDSKQYSENLKHADRIKQGMTDGRGVLSSRSLGYYIKYMLEVALDQIEFMKENIKMNTLGKRIENYIKMSQVGMYSIEPLPKYSELVFKELLIHGEISRGSVEVVINKSRSTATKLIKKLEEMEYIQSDTPKGSIHLKFNAYFASKIIPQLMPDIGE